MIVCGVKAVLRLYVLHIHLPLLSVRHFIKFFFFWQEKKGMRSALTGLGTSVRDEERHAMAGLHNILFHSLASLFLLFLPPFPARVRTEPVCCLATFEVILRPTLTTRTNYPCE